MLGDSSHAAQHRTMGSRVAQPMDVRALLPVLRARSVEVEVGALAVALAHNLTELAWWVASKWPSDDFDAADHPWRRAYLDGTTPAGRAVDAHAALHAACGRYQGATGRDGLDFAHSAIVRTFGSGIADAVLKTLFDIRSTETELDRMIERALHAEDEAAPSPPTAEQCAAAVATLLDVSFSAPRMDSLRACLDALRGLTGSEEADGARRVQQAQEAVGAACQDAVAAGVDPEEIQTALEFWANVTGGARVTLNVFL